MLKTLFDFSQPKSVGLVVFRTLEQFVAPREWARQWTTWVRAKSLDKLRPGKVDNARFVCEHGKVAIDVVAEVDAPREITLVCEKAWRYLCSK